MKRRITLVDLKPPKIVLCRKYSGRHIKSHHALDVYNWLCDVKERYGLNDIDIVNKNNKIIAKRGDDIIASFLIFDIFIGKCKRQNFSKLLDIINVNLK
jgi:hypothetical protein